MKNDVLKKHHFWILLGVVPLCVLIAVLAVSSSVGGEIEKREADIEKAKKEIASKTNPKPDVLIAAIEEAAGKVDSKRGGLWKGNWDRQKDLFTWPTSRQFTGFVRKTKDAEGKDVETPVRVAALKFGDEIPNNNQQFEEFKKNEFYRALYSTADPKKNVPPSTGMADQVFPTRFQGGWEKVLRHVNTWDARAITSEQVWLLMEDVWVQRSLLEAVKSVNAEMAEFTRVRYDRDGKTIDDPDPKAPEKNPLEREFRSRTWEVELRVGEQGGRQFITGRLRNITDRLQILGVTTNAKGERVNAMTLKVWLDPSPNAEPVVLKIGGDFVPGEGAVRPVLGEDAKPLKDKDGRDLVVPANVIDLVAIDDGNLIPTGRTVSEIARVEQVFDVRTVPIRQISAMALGKTDSRWANMKQLLPPQFIKIEDPAAPEGGEANGLSAPTPGGGGGSSSAGGPPPGFGSGTGGKPGGLGGPAIGGGGDQSMASGSGGLQSGGGTIDQVVNGNKRRYVEVNDQVRRMPIGIAVVVDQAYMQDVLVALTNSPLRFQITQVTWKRFRGTLDTGGAGSTNIGDPGGGVVTSGPGDLRGGGVNAGGDPERGGFGIPAPGGKPGSGGLGSAGGPPPGFGTPIPGFGSGSAGGPPPLVGGSAGGPPGFGTGSAGGPPGLGKPSPGQFGSFGQGYGMGSSGGALTSVSEAQLTSGLIELSVYGIVSLYTAPNAPPAEAKDEAKGKDKEDEPKDKQPADPMPKDPMNATPTAPKKRVRRAR